MCKVYTDVGGIKYLYHVCPPACKIIHLLKLVDYLHIKAGNPWYNYYLIKILLPSNFNIFQWKLALLSQTLQVTMKCYVMCSQIIFDTLYYHMTLRLGVK